MKKCFCGAGMLAIFMLFLSLPSAAHAEKYVIIDPGHGLPFTGTMGYSGVEPEANVNLDQALKLRSVLENNTNIKVYMTRTTYENPYDTGGDLIGRVIKANEIAKGNNDNSLYISIHHNSSPVDPSIRGYETHYYDYRYPNSNYPPDPLQIHYSPESMRLAFDVHHAVLSGTPLQNDGHGNDGIVDDYLYVTRNTEMPSILVELGFMSNPTEEKLVESDSFQWQAAKAMAAGIEKFFQAYSVYDYQGNRLKVFVSKTDALNYAKAHDNVSVFDMNSQKTIYSNISKSFGAYNSSDASLNKLFFTQQEAIDYAKTHSNMRVVNNKTDEIVWSNYLGKNFEVIHPTAGVLTNTYQEQQAVDYAQNWKHTAVLNTSTNKVLWAWPHYQDNQYQVFDSRNRLLNSFYIKDNAINYAKIWSNTKVVESATGNVVWNNTKSGYTYSFDDKKLAGANRILTAIDVSKALYPNGFPSNKTEKVVVLARAYQFADALSAGPLAAQYGNAPILLTKTDNLDPAVINELKRLHASKVVILGGTDAVSTNVENQLKSLGYSTDRINGSTRFETNLNINKRLNNIQGVFVASARNFPDALGAAPIAAMDHWAIVLTDKDQITPASLSFLNFKNVVILGGDEAISSKVEKQIINQNGADRVTRLAGADRYETLAKVLDYFKDDLHTNKVLVSTGENFPDALTASSLSVKTHAPMFLVSNTIGSAISNELSQYGQHNVVDQLDVIGGVLSTEETQQIGDSLR